MEGGRSVDWCCVPSCPVLVQVVIKTSRELQKSAKNSIFALHRGKVEDADALLEKFKKTARTLSPTLEAHPTLRISASYVDAMEVRDASPAMVMASLPSPPLP